MGEGGAINIVSDNKLSIIAESFRDWGRDVGVLAVLIIRVTSVFSGN